MQITSPVPARASLRLGLLQVGAALASDHATSAPAAPQPPPHFLCPITLAVMCQPVLASDGQTCALLAICRRPLAPVRGVHCSWIQQSALVLSIQLLVHIDTGLHAAHGMIGRQLIDILVQMKSGP